MIDSELIADRQRGPGFGRLRIANSRVEAEEIRFALMRNQGNKPYLGSGGEWQATEVWHPAEVAVRDDAALVIAVGPDVVDAVVAQPANVAFRLMLTADAVREMGTLKIVQPLYGSNAAGGNETALLDRQQREEDESRRQEDEENERRRQADLEEERLRQAAEAARLATVADVAKPVEEIPRAEPAVAGPRGKGMNKALIAAIVVLLALAGGGAGAWFSCLIPGFGPASCGGGPGDTASGETGSGGTASGETGAGSDAGALTCAGLTDGSACYAVAQKALAQEKLEPARQLFQQAASMGSLEANLAVARMYDPDTWSAAASPAAKPDWETAVFWYEKAARQGDRVAQREAGRLLCGHASTDFEKRQGRTYLEKAAEAGDADATALAASCGE